MSYIYRVFKILITLVRLLIIVLLVAGSIASISLVLYTIGSLEEPDFRPETDIIYDI